MSDIPSDARKHPLRDDKLTFFLIFVPCFLVLIAVLCSLAASLQGCTLRGVGRQGIQQRLLLLGPSLRTAAIAVVCGSALAAGVCRIEVRQTLDASKLLQMIA